MFSAMGRFDYKPEDCFDFHNAISKKIVPIITSFEEKEKRSLIMLITDHGILQWI